MEHKAEPVRVDVDVGAHQAGKQFFFRLNTDVTVKYFVCCRKFLVNTGGARAVELFRLISECTRREGPDPSCRRLHTVRHRQYYVYNAQTSFVVVLVRTNDQEDNVFLTPLQGRLTLRKNWSGVILNYTGSRLQCKFRESETHRWRAAAIEVSKGCLHVNGWMINAREVDECVTEGEDGTAAADASVDDIVDRIRALFLTSAQRQKLRRSIE